MEQYLISPENFSPERAYDEWQALMLTMRHEMELLARLSAWSRYDYRSTLKAIRNTVAAQSVGQVFLWNYDVWGAAVRGSDEVFAGLPLEGEDIPERLQYWSLDRDIYLSDEGSEHIELSKEYTVAGVLLIPMKVVEGKTTTSSGFLVAVLYQPSEELTRQLKAEQAGGAEVSRERSLFRLRFWPGLREGEPITRELAEYVAGGRFMRLEVVEARRTNLPRPARRREEKEGRSVPEIRTVLLRARKSEVGEAELTEASRRDFACHFFVSSHWRKANRRMKEQRPVFVPAYIKGDTDKPFRPPRTTIYHVNR